MDMECKEWGEVPGLGRVELFTLGSGSGVEVDVSTLGATLVGARVPDREGEMADVLLGYDSAEEYMKGQAYLGCATGRFAGRISGASFTLDGVRADLEKNHGPHQLHGGVPGFGKRLWQVVGAEGGKLSMEYSSPDGEGGFPGNLAARVDFTLGQDGALRMDFSAKTDKPTVVNLTSHAYFNLAGHGSGDCLDHLLELAGESYLPMDEESIPTGERASAMGTALDFSKPSAIGGRIAELDGDVPYGYDHYFIGSKDKYGCPDGLAWLARAGEPGSGRILDVFSTSPGLVFYSGNYLDGEPGKSGAVYGRRAGFCLEAQGWPDAPNNPGFPSVALWPGQVYENSIVYRFGAE